MSDVAGETPDLLTHTELKQYKEALTAFGTVLQAHGKAAMDLADKMLAVQELSKMRADAHRKVLKVIERIAKARNIDFDKIADIDTERAAIVWKTE